MFLFYWDCSSMAFLEMASRMGLHTFVFLCFLLNSQVAPPLVYIQINHRYLHNSALGLFTRATSTFDLLTNRRTMYRVICRLASAFMHRHFDPFTTLHVRVPLSKSIMKENRRQFNKRINWTISSGHQYLLVIIWVYWDGVWSSGKFN